jgi:hypothetical protein
VRRADRAPTGRALPTELTAAGRRQLAVASAAVRGVEDRMTAGLAPAARRQLAEALRGCVTALR